MTEYKVIRSRRRTLCISVKADGRVIVRSPSGMSENDIRTVVEKAGSWIEKAKKRVASRPASGMNIPLGEEEIKALKRRAAEHLPELIGKYSELTGLKPSAVKITSARTRFGSCNSKNALCFSYRLMLYPEAATEAVVMHELAHIKYKNHGEKFYSLIYKYMPDYRERKKLLRQ